MGLVQAPLPKPLGTADTPGKVVAVTVLTGLAGGGHLSVMTGVAQGSRMLTTCPICGFPVGCTVAPIDPPDPGVTLLAAHTYSRPHIDATGTSGVIEETCPGSDRMVAR